MLSKKITGGFNSFIQKLEKSFFQLKKILSRNWVYSVTLLIKGEKIIYILDILNDHDVIKFVSATLMLCKVLKSCS